MVNYYDILPSGIAKSQIAFERRKLIDRLISSGVTPKELARKFGVSRSYIHQKIQQIERRKLGDRISPIERYFCDNKDIFELSEIIGKSCKKLKRIQEQYEKAKDDLIRLERLHVTQKQHNP